MAKVTRFLIGVLLVALLVPPAELAAKSKRGAILVLTKLDGTQVSGELIAVKPESLLLLGPGGTDETVGLTDIATVRVVRKPPIALTTIAGFAAGAILGYGWMRNEPDADRGDVWGAAAILGAGGALGGLGIGLGIGADAVFRVAGEPAGIVSQRLGRLKDFSREGRLRLVPGPAVPAPSPGPAPPAASGTGPSRPSRRPRFRLNLGAAINAGEGRMTMEGSFRFPGDVPPGEAGPFDMPIYLSRYRNGALGPVSLAYEWTDHWLIEIEAYLPKLNPAARGSGDLSFVSTTDGRTYRGEAVFDHDASFASLLIGPVFRPLAPSVLDRHAIEIGLAAGPARIGLAPVVEDYYVPWPAGHKVVLSARAHAGYDFYFVPAFSLGLFAGYRYLQAGFPPVTSTLDVGFRDFSDTSGYYPEPSFYRPTEMSFPSLTYSLTGVTYGVRLTFRL